MRTFGNTRATLDDITDRVDDVATVAEAQRRLGRPIKDQIEVSSSGRVLQTAFRAARIERTFLDDDGHVVLRSVPGSFHEFISRRRLPDGSLDLAFDDAGLLEGEDLLHDDDIALHALHFRDVRDATGTVAQPGDLHDDVDGRGHLFTDRPHRQVKARHQGQCLESTEGVTRGVGVHRGERAIVARVHRLQHVQGLAGAALAYHDAVRTHTERVLHQVSNRDGAAALDVGRSSLHAEHMVLMQLQFFGVLDGHDAFASGDER